MTRIQIALPASRAAPLQWIANVIFGERLGLSFETILHDGADVVISAQRGRVVLPSLFPDLTGNPAGWGHQMPALPLAGWNCADDLPEVDIDAPLPVLYGRPGMAIEEGTIRCSVDIFGALFFMLSRFEELVVPDRDAHDRFPATASLAWKSGFLYRPIVDEYVELLWAMLKRVWPGLERWQREGKIRISCDVDQPFDRVGRNPRLLMRSLAGDIGKRRDMGLAFRRTRNFLAHRRGDLRFDPYYTFDWYMDVCERNGHTAAFYFIADHSAGSIDGTYDIEEPRVLKLMKTIADRGHEIGLHGSYNTFRDPAQILKEKTRLQDALKHAEIEASVKGNRQHYLRWDAVETSDHLDAAGFQYDTTGSFPDRPGFRYGTAWPFPMWSWRKMSALRILQKPLIVMECSVLAPGYMGLAHTPEARSLVDDLRRNALKWGGDFSLLWHNSFLLTAYDRDFLCDTLERRI